MQLIRTLQVSKMEMQLQNMSKQKESFKQHMKSVREEQRNSKESCSLLQREVLEYQRKAESYREELNVKVDTRVKGGGGLSTS